MNNSNIKPRKREKYARYEKSFQLLFRIFSIWLEKTNKTFEDLICECAPSLILSRTLTSILDFLVLDATFFAL